MSEAIHDAIAALEDERTVMDQKITTVRDAVLEQIDTAIETLRELAGGTKKATKAKRAARDLRPSVRPSVRPSAKANARSLPNDDRSLKILGVLEDHKGSMRPGELMKAMKASSAATLRYWMKPLIKAKRVIATGKTAGRRFSLPGCVPKEAP